MDNGKRSSTSPRQSSTPFAFGSPITNSDKSLLSPGKRHHNLLDAGNATLGNSSITAPGGYGGNSSSSNNLPSRLQQHVIRGRIKAQDVYGGPLVFGGSNSLRKSRLLSSTPYEGALRFGRMRAEAAAKGRNTTASSSTSFNSTANHYQSNDGRTLAEDGMSSTARWIFDTLEKMSTPVRDAQKIPLSLPSTSSSTEAAGNLSRCEKRRQILSEFDVTLDASDRSASKRRRPNLSNKSSQLNHSSLNGPPLRTLMSPVSATARPPVSQALKSARIASQSSTSSHLLPKSRASPSEANSLSEFHTSGLLSFPVPALQVTTDAKSPPAPFFSTSTPATGKIRSKLCHPESNLNHVTAAPLPLPSHLATPSQGLKLSSMPTFKFHTPDAISVVPSSGAVPKPAATVSKTSSVFTPALLSADTRVESKPATKSPLLGKSPLCSVPEQDEPSAKSSAEVSAYLPKDDLGEGSGSSRSSSTATCATVKTADTLPLSRTPFTSLASKSPSEPFSVLDSTTSSPQPIQFAFSLPLPMSKATTSKSSDAQQCSTKFTFSQPQNMTSAQPASLVHKQITPNTAAATNNNDYNLMSMPDLTATTPTPFVRFTDTSHLKLKSKVLPGMFTQDTNKLPDVTVSSGGIKVAKELKKESVLSILGGLSSSSSTPWDPKFKMGGPKWSQL